VQSIVRSDHRAVLAYQDGSLLTAEKARHKLMFRRRTPAQHAQMLQYLASADDKNLRPSYNTQDNFDTFYTRALQLLDKFYPECTVTVMSHDSDYVTPEVKIKVNFFRSLVFN